MPEKQLLGSRYVIDINVAAIYLVENHPRNKYVTEFAGLRNREQNKANNI